MLSSCTKFILKLVTFHGRILTTTAAAAAAHCRDVKDGCVSDDKLPKKLTWNYIIIFGLFIWLLLFRSKWFMNSLSEVSLCQEETLTEFYTLGMKREKNIYIKESKNRWIENGWKNRLMAEQWWMDEWMDGQTDEWMDRDLFVSPY